MSGPQGFGFDRELAAAAFHASEVRGFAEDAHQRSMEYLTAFVTGYDAGRSKTRQFFTKLGWLTESPQIEAYRSEIMRRSGLGLCERQ